MAKYTYEAVTLSGKTQKGSLEAENETDALAQLKKANLIPIAVAEQTFLKREFELRKNRRLNTDELVWIMRKLASYQKVGMPLRMAVNALIEQKPRGAAARALGEVEERLTSGSSIAEAFRETGKFDPLIVSMIEAGERSGKLEDTLRMASDLLSKRVRLKQAVKSAVTLPVAEGLLAVAVTIGLIAFVVPRIAKMFTSLGAKLPGITQFYVNLSHTITHDTIFVLIGLFLVWRLLKLVWKRPDSRIRAELALFRLPIVGELAQATATARVSTTLAGLTSSSVPLRDALEYASTISSFLCIRQAVTKAAEEVVSMGVPLSVALARTKGLPKDLGYAIATGEASGTVSTAIATYADDLSNWVDSQLKGLTGLLEPILTVFFGLLLGPVGIAIYIPTIAFGQAVLHGTGGHP